MNILYVSTYESRYSKLGNSCFIQKRPWKDLVPRISDQILECVIYLYPSEEDASEGRRAGGTGFLVVVTSESHEDIGYFYAVTNSHVVREGNSPVVRMNTSQGDMAVLMIDADQWVHHQDGDDIAVCPLVLSNPDTYRFKAIGTEMFLTRALMRAHDIGPGDEAYMVGRFVSHEGRQRNTPLARFGNISMMPWEPIPHERGILQESILVEMRSLSGFSGSPVFVEMPPMSPRPGGIVLGHGRGPWLLGVDWAHIAAYEKVKKKIEEGGREKLVDAPERLVVKGNSGQMAVVPAWRLQELLDQEELVVRRQYWDRERTRIGESSDAVLDIQTGQHVEHDRHAGDNSDAFTQEDFEDAIDRVSRREPPPDQES
jgi:hypothetical protein